MFTGTVWYDQQEEILNINVKMKFNFSLLNIRDSMQQHDCMIGDLSYHTARGRVASISYVVVIYMYIMLPCHEPTSGAAQTN